MASKPVYTWIIGASSGIGEALARELAHRGETLCVSARNAAALETVCASLEGAGHCSEVADATDYAGLERVAKTLMARWGRIDRIISMIGVYTPMKLGVLDLAETQNILNINLMGQFNITEAALHVLTPQGFGQIALCGSVAGYRGLPNAQPYAASKAGVISLATSLRAEHGRVLDIKVINPGFVSSRLTEKNDFDMPFRISPEEAARSIANELNGKAFEIHFPKIFTRMAKFLSLFPDGLYFRAVRGGASTPTK